MNLGSLDCVSIRYIYRYELIKLFKEYAVESYAIVPFKRQRNQAIRRRSDFSLIWRVKMLSEKALELISKRNVNTNFQKLRYE